MTVIMFWQPIAPSSGPGANVESCRSKNKNTDLLTFKMISTTALQSIILLQVISKTISQFPVPFPFPGGPSPMMPGIAPMAPQPFLPGGMGGAIPMSYPMQQKMPMVVMPYYSKSADKAHNKNKRKKRRPKKIHFDDSSSEDDDSGSSSDEFNFRAKPKNKRRQVLTPVVSYVTKDGYVVYQKKIKKDKARDWLEMSKRARESQERDDREDDRETLLRKLKKLKFSKRHHKNHH